MDEFSAEAERYINEGNTEEAQIILDDIVDKNAERH